MKILGINISHHMSYAFFEEEVLKEYYEEDRFNKIKDFNPISSNLLTFKGVQKFKDIEFDCLAISSYGRSPQRNDYVVIEALENQIKHKEYYFNYYHHHLYHAICALYLSPFKEATAVIRDGGGAHHPAYPGYQEVDSIYHLNKNTISSQYQYYSNFRFTPFDDDREVEKDNYVFSSKKIGGSKYLDYSHMAGFENRPGELMGIAPYAMVEEKYDNINYEQAKLGEIAQRETLEETYKLIDKCKSSRNIVLSGGYFMNCLNNFKLVKKYPKLNFFVDPIAHDGGTAIGAALYYENYKK